MDSMNWTVEVLRDVRKKDGARASEWCVAQGSCGPFCGRPDGEPIVRWLLANAPELDGFEGTMAEHARAVDAASRRIAASIAAMA